MTNETEASAPGRIPGVAGETRAAVDVTPSIGRAIPDSIAPPDVDDTEPVAVDEEEPVIDEPRVLPVTGPAAP